MRKTSPKLHAMIEQAARHIPAPAAATALAMTPAPCPACAALKQQIAEKARRIDELVALNLSVARQIVEAQASLDAARKARDHFIALHGAAYGAALEIVEERE